VDDKNYTQNIKTKVKYKNDEKKHLKNNQYLSTLTTYYLTNYSMH
jgi:hypothetical protein